MEFTDLVSRRYSVRAYKPDPVSDDCLKVVLEAARLAPSASNRQPFRLIVIHTQGREAELSQIYQREWFLQAPLIIFACGIPAEAWVHRNGKSYMDMDVAIAMDYLTLAAANIGLGTCWIASFDFDVARQVLGLPKGVEPLVVTPLGYPADQLQPKERKALAELVRYERWS